MWTIYSARSASWQRAVHIQSIALDNAFIRTRYIQGRKSTAIMSDDRVDKKIHAAAKPASVPSRKPAESDLTCTESQIEDILSEGESSRPMSKSDKGLHVKRQPKSSR